MTLLATTTLAAPPQAFLNMWRAAQDDATGYPVTNGLIARYTFDGTLDAEGGGLTMTNWPTDGAFGPPIYVAGKFGNALQSYATNRYGLKSKTNITNYPFSAAGWFNADTWEDLTLVGIGGFGRSDSATTYANFTGLRANTTNATPRMEHRATTSRQASGEAAFYKPNIWYHAASVFLSQTQAFMYVNGALVASSTADAGANFVNTPEGVIVMKVGQRNDSATSATEFRGLLDEFVFFSVGLTSNEVLQIYEWSP